MNDHKKHIVFCTPGFPKNEDDSTCIPPLQAFVKTLYELNQFHITILSLHYPLNKSYRWHGIEVYAVGANNNKFPFRLYSWKKFNSTLYRINKVKKIDILHSFWATDVSYLIQKISKRLRIPHFITLMGQDVDASNKYLNRIKPIASQLICVSERQAELLIQHYKVSSTIIPWGIDRIKTNKKEIAIDILGVGSLIPLKNFNLFIDVVAILAKKGKVKKAMIIGEGELFSHLKEKIDQLELTEVITLTGKLPRNEVIEKFQTSRVFLHTSEYESLGYVFQEALATSTPIVSKAVGISKECEVWKIGSNTSELVLAVEEFLQYTTPLNFEVLRMEETVKAYIDSFYS